MRRRLVLDTLTMLVALGPALARPVLAQEQVQLRFVPPGAAPVAVAFQTHTRVVGSGGRAHEFADVGLLTERSLGMMDSVHVLHVTYDSVWVRAREAQGAWREFTVPPADSLWMQLRMDERLGVVETHGRRVPGFTDPVGVVTGLRGLVLPREPLRAGDNWRARIALALPRSPNDTSARLLGALEAEAVLTLDSIVPRASDTLAHVTAVARTQRITVVDPFDRQPERWVFSGELRGALVWSTGWNAFVAGTHRSRVLARRPREGGEAEAVTLEWETTTRYQVRP